MTNTELQDVFELIVKRIVERFNPEKVLLFGSYARATSSPDSDADILVIMDVPSSKRKIAIEIDLLMQGIPIPTDIIVLTPADIEKYRDFPNTIIYEAIREGKSSMNEPHEIEEEVRRWIEKAEHDLMAAEHNLIIVDKGLTDIICFHCQQTEHGTLTMV